MWIFVLLRGVSWPGRCCSWEARIRHWRRTSNRWPWRGRCHNPYALGMALHLSCIFHQLRGDGTTLRERSDELVALTTEQGFPHFVGSEACFRGWATIPLGGSISDAIDTMRDGLATKRATGAEIKVPYYLGLLAEAHTRVNRTTEALNLMREALELAERTDERWY